MSPCSLDYPGIGPEHSALKDWGRAEYFSATDNDALEAFQLLSRTEGIIPALETSHALAHLKVSSYADSLPACFLPDTFSACSMIQQEAMSASKLSLAHQEQLPLHMQS